MNAMSVERVRCILFHIAVPIPTLPPDRTTRDRQRWHQYRAAWPTFNIRQQSGACYDEGVFSLLLFHRVSDRTIAPHVYMYTRWTSTDNTFCGGYFVELNRDHHLLREKKRKEKNEPETWHMDGGHCGVSRSHGESRPLCMCSRFLPYTAPHSPPTPRLSSKPGRHICIKCVSVGQRAGRLTCHKHMRSVLAPHQQHSCMSSESNVLSRRELVSANENVRKIAGVWGVCLERAWLGIEKERKGEGDISRIQKQTTWGF